MNFDKHFQCRRLFMVAGCIAFSVIALLLWGRLKLVAGVPRTALADPETTGAVTARPAPALPADRPDLGGD